LPVFPVSPVDPVEPVDPVVPVAPVAPVAPAGPGTAITAAGRSQALSASVINTAEKIIEYFMWIPFEGLRKSRSSGGIRGRSELQRNATRT
jgi:hypothetical protein